MGKDKTPLFDVQQFIDKLKEEHPVIFSKPDNMDIASSWKLLAPAGSLLVSILKPKSIVELGVYNGFSFLNFCRAVKELDLKTTCHGIDSWEGDQHAEYETIEGYGMFEGILRKIERGDFKNFASLSKMFFDEALKITENKSVDLLHIDGCHTYEAVLHDFESWLPKMSNKGVIIFHDTRVFGNEFGVYELWDEIKYDYPNFELTFGSGLGILAVGSDVPDELIHLLKSNENDKEKLDRFLFELGRNFDE